MYCLTHLNRAVPSLIHDLPLRSPRNGLARGVAGRRESPAYSAASNPIRSARIFTMRATSILDNRAGRTDFAQ
jgi:hypothetical protein